MATRRRASGQADQSKKLERAESKIIEVGESFEWLKMLAYAQNGKGKTRFGASGPRPVCVIDCNERGSMSIRNYEGVDVFKVDTWVDIDLAYWYLHKNSKGYQTVVIDTESSLQQLCMKFVLGDEASRDATKDPNMPGKREWGKVGELMKTQILQFRNLPMHVIFLAQERRGFTEDDDESVPDVFPEVSPSIRQTLTASVDIIGRMYVKEVIGKRDPKTKKRSSAVQYRMLIGPSERYVTKDRSEAGLPSTLLLKDDEHNLERLVQRIKKGA